MLSLASLPTFEGGRELFRKMRQIVQNAALLFNVDKAKSFHCNHLAYGTSFAL